MSPRTPLKTAGSPDISIWRWQVKAALKGGLIAGASAWMIWLQWDAILALSAEPLAAAIPHFGRVTLYTFLAALAAFALLALIDVPYQIWHYHHNLRMTKEEVRQESKETEGDPQIKARIRSMQREQARRRMMQAVPKTDVAVTNPLHFAVALRYDDKTMVVSRVSSSSDLSEQLTSQLFGKPQAIYLAAGILTLMGILPGMPHVAFLLIGSLLGGGAYWLRQQQQQAADLAAAAIPAAAPAEPEEVGWHDVAQVDRLGLEVGYRLVQLLDKGQDGELLRRIRGIRKKIAQDIGFLIPPVHIRDNLQLRPSAYRT